MRTSKQQVESVFAMLATATGHHVAKSWDDVGAWKLTYAACYGGYAIEEISNEHGGIFHPLGERRRPAGEMWSTMHFALRAIESGKVNV